MSTHSPVTTEFLKLANLYPSPHNGQPIRLRFINNTHFELLFEKQRGLQASDISFIFSFVSMGVFAEHLKMCGEALGHKVSFTPELPKESKLHGSGVVSIGQGTVVWEVRPADTLIHRALLHRQTSRKKYTEGVDVTTNKRIEKIASDNDMVLQQLNTEQARQAIWLNQRAVFDDMFDEPARRELDHWLRYNKTQKEEFKDGLAYDCMELDGRLMKYIVNHPNILRTPGISWLLQAYYTRTMTDNSDVFYMLAPFASEADSYHVGEVIMKIWEAISELGYYLHPFGTIMSNHSAHRDFIKLTGIKNESRKESYLVFIFRAGHSDTPERSLRLSFEKHLLMEAS